MYKPRTITWDLDPVYKDEAYMDKIAKVFVGVDVAKDSLDVHVHPAGKKLKIENSIDGLADLINVLESHCVGQIVCEASGGYEHLMIRMLSKAGYKVWSVEPGRIKAFIASEGVKFKNDPNDAKMIALFASQKISAYNAHSLSDKEVELRNWVKRRSDLVNMMLMEKKRLNHPGQMSCKQEITEHINFIKSQMCVVDKKIKAIINDDEDFNKRAKIIASVPGLGAVTTASLIADVPELGSLENKEAAALVGFAPYIQQSGKSKGIAFTKCGRFEPRRKVYMATLTAIRFNPVIKVFYNKLIIAGKKPKVAIVAAANKLIRIINAMLRNEVMWNENYAAN